MASFFAETFKYVLLTLVLFYGGVPLMLYYFPQLQRWFIFLAFCRKPDLNQIAVKNPLRDFSNPADFNMTCTRNFYLEHDNVKLGVWQIVSSSIRSKALCQSQNAHDWEHSLAAANTPVIVYAHGNAFDRTAPHRRDLYRTLAEAGYSVLTFDYRGFGDSTGTPTEEGVAADVKFVYMWALQFSGSNPVFIWGHSLGTGIGTLASLELCTTGNCPAGLILEAPFNKLMDVVEHHPITLPFRWLPHFEMCFVAPLGHSGISFDTEDRLQHVKCPVMILHAHDDRIVPFVLTERLMRKAKEHGVHIQLHEFPTEREYGHNKIFQAPELPKLIRKCPILYYHPQFNAYEAFNNRKLKESKT